jgi:hypothetical protein
MSGTYPTNPKPSEIQINSFQPTLVSVSHNLRRQVRTRGGQRWEFSVSYKGYPRSEMIGLYAFLQAQQGQYGSFQFTPALIGNTRGTATTAISNGNTASGSVVTITTNGTLKAGDYIKFDSHNKVYMVTQDFDGPSGALNIMPSLQQAILTSDPITINNVQFTVARKDDNLEMTLAAPYFFDCTVKLVEVI